MIKLLVEPYCHDCPMFEVKANRTAFYSDNHLESMSDCIITCEHEKLCNRINEYLTSKVDEQKKGE